MIIHTQSIHNLGLTRNATYHTYVRCTCSRRFIVHCEPRGTRSYTLRYVREQMMAQGGASDELCWMGKCDVDSHCKMPLLANCVTQLTLHMSHAGCSTEQRPTKSLETLHLDFERRQTPRCDLPKVHKMHHQWLQRSAPTADITVTKRQKPTSSHNVTPMGDRTFKTGL